MPIFLNDFSHSSTSQHGEDGILKKIFEAIGVENRTLVDVGAFDLKNLSNVYSFWKEAGWRAVLVEGNPVYYARMKKQGAPPNVTLLNCFVSPKGEACLDRLLGESGLPANLDLLSIDVDGVDYHIWKNLDSLKPRVVVIEFNPTIPPHLSVVALEKGSFLGSSAKALMELGKAKGYALVACTKTNLFFVWKEFSNLFQYANDLEKLMDISAINYVMTSYDGGLFYSNKFFPYGYNPFSNQPLSGMENSGQYFIPNQSLGFYIGLKIKYGWLWLKQNIFKPVYLSVISLKITIKNQTWLR